MRDKTSNDVEQRGDPVGEPVGDMAKEAKASSRKVADQVDQQAAAAGERAEATGGAVRQAGAELRSRGAEVPGQLAERAGTPLQRAGRYLRESDGDAIVRDVEQFARRRPWIAVAIALAAGLAAGRLLKASGGGRRWSFGGRRWS